MRTLFAFTFAMIAIASFANTQNQMLTLPTYNIDLFHRNVTLEAGTAVFLETTLEINSREMSEGQLITFQVKTDVFVKHKVAIAAGAMAVGQITKITKTTYNHPEEISIIVNYVQSVDGQQIELQGLEQTLRGRFSGEGSTIQSGTLLVANVQEDKKIRVQ